MLGEKIGEETGKITSQRVLPDFKLETSFRSSGTLLGLPVSGMGSYESVLRPDGTLVGEGQGIAMSKDGGSATWRGHGMGVRKPDGSASYRGSLIFTTTFSKWSRLNNCAVVFEYEVDAEGNTRSSEFEWR